MAENKKFTRLINSDGTKQAVALDMISFDEQTKKLTLYSSVDNTIKEETTIPASEVDATLSQSGLAADAKATGDAVKDVVKVGGTASGFTGIIVGTGEEEIELVEQKDFDAEIAKLNAKVGTPLVANTASAMVDTTKIYVYTGNENGYVNGNWYFYNGTNWESGGVYNAVAVQTDKTLTQENKAADAKKTGDEISQLMSDLSELGGAINAEPYNPYVWEMGSYVSLSTGSTLRKTNASPYNVTRKRFDVTEVTFNSNITANSGYYIALLEIDDSNVIVSTSGYVANVQAEAGKKYAGVVKASNDADITAIDINTILSFSAADTQVVRNMKQIESISDALDRIEPSLIEPINVDVIDGYGLKKSDGGLISNSAYQYTDYVSTDGVIEFYVKSRAYSNVCGACAYDANKNFLRSYFTTGNTALPIDDTITPLADEKFFRFSTVNKVTQPLIVVKYQYAENLGERVSATEKVCADITPFSGKTLLNFGDSIAAGDGNNGKAYADYIAERYEMTLYDYSHGGDTLSTVRTNNIIGQVDVAITDHSADNIDYILLEGGTNDIGNSVPVGEMVDGYDITSPARDNGTIYGALETIVAKLRNAFPTAKIIFVTTHKMATRSTAGQNNCHEAIVKTCEKWCLPIADIYLHGEINSNISSMLPSCFPAHPDDPETYPTGYDRTHPSEGGYKKFYVPYIVGVMRTI